MPPGGIRPIMITGDHIDTAMAIARELGILTDQTRAVTGSALDGMSDEEFEKEFREGYGVAVDIGTTTVAMDLVRLSDGKYFLKVPCSMPRNGSGRCTYQNHLRV